MGKDGQRKNPGTELRGKLQKLDPSHPSHAEAPLGHPRRTAHHGVGLGKAVLDVLELPVRAAEVGAKTVIKATEGALAQGFKAGALSAAGEGILVLGSQVGNHYFPEIISSTPNMAEGIGLGLAVAVTVGAAVYGAGKGVFKYWASELTKEAGNFGKGIDHGIGAVKSVKETGRWFRSRKSRRGK